MSQLLDHGGPHATWATDPKPTPPCIQLGQPSSSCHVHSPNNPTIPSQESSQAPLPSPGPTLPCPRNGRLKQNLEKRQGTWTHRPPTLPNQCGEVALVWEPRGHV